MFLIATGKRQHSQYYRKLLHSNSFIKDTGNMQRLRKIPIKIYENDLATAQKKTANQRPFNYYDECQQIKGQNGFPAPAAAVIRS